MTPRWEAVVVGCSSGGLAALQRLLAPLPGGFPIPVIVAAHMSPDAGGLMAEILDGKCALSVSEAEEKEPVRPGGVYIAPPGYHLLMERDRTMALSVDARVSHARPSIDVLFETASDVYGGKLIGIVLTGANNDGAAGLGLIRKRGGMAMIQDPSDAEASEMPRAALGRAGADVLGTVEALSEALTAAVGERTAMA